MDNRERRDMEMAYIADAAVNEEMRRCRKILQKLNFMDRSDFEGVAAVVKELLGKSENAWINPPFYCDYGSHIKVGKNLFANYNCTIIDVAPVTIGDYCQMAPNVAIYTAGHPIYPTTRNAGNPCRVIRKITEEDRKKLFHEEEIDAEAWEDIVARGFGGESDEL